MRSKESQIEMALQMADYAEMMERHRRICLAHGSDVHILDESNNRCTVAEFIGIYLHLGAVRLEILREHNRAEPSTVRLGGSISPELVFKSPYFLDFTGLKGYYSEKDLEDMIISGMQQLLMELGNGFTFVDRQKRMIIDGEDFYLDLLFYHRKLHRLVALDLKKTKFKAAYKGQMELYLRWLDKYLSITPNCPTKTF